MPVTGSILFRNKIRCNNIINKSILQELEIRAVLLDEMMQCKDKPTKEQHLLDLEVKSLRDTRQLLDKVGITEATTFIEENAHPRLWYFIGFTY